MRNILSVSLSEEMVALIGKVAGELGISKSELVKNAVLAYTRQMRFYKLRERLEKKARKQGIFTDEDVFERVS